MKDKVFRFRPVIAFYVFLIVEAIALTTVLILKYTLFKNTNFDDPIDFSYIFFLCTLLVCIVLTLSLVFDVESPKEKTLLYSISIFCVALGATFSFASKFFDVVPDSQILRIVFRILYKAAEFAIYFFCWRLIKITALKNTKYVEAFDTIQTILFAISMIVLVVMTIVVFYSEGAEGCVDYVKNRLMWFDVFLALSVIISFIAVLICKLNKDFHTSFITYFIASLTIIILSSFNFQVDLVFFGMGLVFIVLRINFYSLISKDSVVKELEISRLEIKAMTNQIRPHFLYNSLTAIMGIDDCGKKTREAIASFGDYLRGNINSIDNSEIEFEKEIEFVENYLFLEKLRFKDRISVIFKLDYKEFAVPALSVQMLVENAIKHGSLNLDRKLKVIVCSYKKGNKIYIEVHDNGTGFDVNKQLDRTHTGLYNLKNRLELISKGELVINSEFNKGTVAVIKLPVRRTK